MTTKLPMIEPTITTENLHRTVEANIPVATLPDILNKYNISESTLIKLLTFYFSSYQLKEIDEYICRELDADVLYEGIDTDPDTLINKLPSNELKSMVKSAGVTLKGNESKEELTGMVKALSKDEACNSDEDKEVKTEGGLLPEYIGGYKADVYLKLPEDVDVDTLASEIEESLKQASPDSCLKKASVENISITQLHKGLFETKKRSKFAK